MPSSLLTVSTVQGTVYSEASVCVCVCLVCWDTEKGGDNLKDKNGSIKRLQCCDSLSVHTDIHIGTYLYLSSFRVWAVQENRGGLSGLEASGQ